MSIEKTPKIDISMCERFVIAREALGLKRKDLATAFDLPVANIGEVENQKREPSKTMIKVLFNQYGVNLNWLLTGEGQMFLGETSISQIETQLVASRGSPVPGMCEHCGQRLGIESLLAEKERVIQSNERTIQDKERLITMTQRTLDEREEALRRCEAKVKDLEYSQGVMEEQQSLLKKKTAS